MTDKNTVPNTFFTIDLLQKLFLLIAAFVCTTVVGALLSFYFQSKSSYNNYKTGLIESERKEAKNIFVDVTTAMDERVYFSQLVNDNYSLSNGQRVPEAKWEDYKRSMDKWNININKHEELLGLYFGTLFKVELEKIHSKFLNLNKGLNTIRPGGNETIHSDNKQLIGIINTDIFVLSRKMIIAIQDDSIGRIPSLKKFVFADFWR